MAGGAYPIIDLATSGSKFICHLIFLIHSHQKSAENDMQCKIHTEDTNEYSDFVLTKMGSWNLHFC